MADVIDAQGVVITITDGTTPTTVATVIGGIDTFDFGDGEASDIDITTLASTAKEYKQGLQDFGNLNLNLKVRDPSDVGQAVMSAAKAARDTRQIVMTFLSGDIATFNAYVKSISNAGGVDGILAGSAALKISGTVVWS